MRLTTKGRFAVTAMIDLGLRQSSGPVTLAAISQRQAISLSYLEQLFGKLRRNELVESTRGPGGGYTLSRDASLITVAEIITASCRAKSTISLCGTLLKNPRLDWKRVFFFRSFSDKTVNPRSLSVSAATTSFGASTAPVILAPALSFAL